MADPQQQTFSNVQPIPGQTFSSVTPIAGASGAPSAEQPGWLDREIPLTSHAAATESGVQSVVRGTRDAVRGTLALFDPRPKDKTEENVMGVHPAMLPIYRILRSVGHTAQDATQLAGALHDINNSADPVGTYAKAVQEMAGQGAGQAIVGAATTGLAKGAGAVGRAIAENPEAAATAPVRLGARAAETAINQKIVPVRALAKIMSPADAAEATPFKMPGRDFGLPKAPPAEVAQASGLRTGAQPAVEPSQALSRVATPQATPEPSVRELPSDLDATGQNKPFAGGLDEPKPAKVLDATRENKPFAGGMDEYTPPKPRTIVTDPATGKPEFSDVVEAKQQAAPTQQPPAAPTPPAAAAPAAAAKPAAAPAAAEPGPAAADLLDRLKGVADRISKQESAAPGTAGEDLLQQLKDSVTMVEARKAVNASHAGGIPESGVMTNVPPKNLLDRWGVDADSFAEGREQTRGMKPDESAAAIAKLKKAYQNGQAVDPVMETRDADNNIIDVDGRGRALAAHQAGVERIPIIVRRMQPAAATVPQ